MHILQTNKKIAKDFAYMDMMYAHYICNFLELMIKNLHALNIKDPEKEKMGKNKK